MMKRWWKACFFLWILLPVMVVAQPTHLTGFRILQQTGTGTLRIVFELDQKTHYRYFGLTDPHRLVIDFDDTTALVNLRKLQPSVATVIEDIRAAKKEDARYRVVFDLKDDVVLKKMESFSDGNHQDTITLELHQQLSKNRVSTVAASNVQPSPLAKNSPRESLSRNSKTPSVTPTKPIMTAESSAIVRPVVVVIDPGHGGKDPGALGAGGSREKNVVLAISKELATALQAQPGVNVYLTRKEDVYLTLRQRLRIARQYKADIFIAIHADAYRNGDSQGASVYALSLGGASSEAARWLAAAENYSELGGVDLKDKNDVLRSVLINLSQTATITASLQLGHDVLSQLNKFTPLHHDAVEQAPFVVLKSPDIPSVLVETGFLSNPKEETLLRSQSYQHQLAQGIMKGVYAYFYQQPPPGTIIAAQVMMGKKGQTV